MVQRLTGHGVIHRGAVQGRPNFIQQTPSV